MRTRLRRSLSIILIAVVLLANFGSASSAYASEVGNVGEEQITESADGTIAESGEGAQQDDGLTENAEDGDEEANSADSGETDTKDADDVKQEGDAAADQAGADAGQSGNEDDDAITDDASAEDPESKGTEGETVEGAADEEGAGGKAAGEDADAVEEPADGTASKGAPEEKGTTEGADKKKETARKGAAKAPADELGIDGRGGLVILKQIQGIPEGEYKTKFKIRLLNGTEPISGFTIESGDTTYVTDENGEFTYEMTITVSGTQGSNGVGFTVPAPCNYIVEEVECDSPLAVSTEKTANTGTTVVNQGTTTNWYTKRGRLEVTAKVARYATDYNEYAPIAEHTIELTYNGEPLSGTFPVEGAPNGETSLTFDDSGKATIGVRFVRTGDEVVPIKVLGIPQGTTITVTFTDPIKDYLGWIPTESTTLQSPLFQADCLNKSWSYYVSGDQYFYYYDTTGKAPEIRYYFLNRAGESATLVDTKMSYTYLDDGTKLYYFDCNGSEHEITVKSGERVVCACFPWDSTDGIGVRYTPVGNVRINNIYGTVRPIDGAMDSYTSWSGNLDKRGVLFVAADAYALETVHKKDRFGKPVDSTFCLTNSTSGNKKKYSFIHHDTYEYNGTEYSNVYEVDLDKGLKDFDSDDADTFIKTDENGDFHVLYPRPLDNSIGSDREGTGSSTSGGIQGGYLYEVECDNDHYFGQEYWTLSGVNQRLNYDENVTYDGRVYHIHEYMHTPLGNAVDPSTFDYSKLDLGKIDDGPELIGEIEAVNGSYPSVVKRIATPSGYSYEADPEQKFWFDVYHNGTIVKSFSLAAGESYQLSPSNIEGISQNNISEYYVVEKGLDGWTHARALPASNQWRVTEDGYRFGPSVLSLFTEQDLTVENKRQSKELTIQKTVRNAPSGASATTRFKVRLWDEYEDGSKAPIKNFKTTVGEETITGDENGEFFIDVVTTGTEPVSKTIKVPAYCHYEIEEVSCSLGVTLQVSKTNDTGVMEDDVESEWENELIELSVSKVDVAGGEELAGAHIQILDSKKNVIEEWNSEETAHKVIALFNAGEEYTLHETVAPDGYLVTSDTTFSIDKDGNVTTSGSKTTDEDGNTVLLVNDAKTSVRISKVDIAGGEELEGAHIQVIDGKGNVVDEWDSTKEAHVIEGLKTGEEYTLKETVAPAGYTVTAETTFTIDKEGKVTSTGTTTKDEDGNTVLLVEDAKTHIEVSKVDIADGKELEGAHIQILDSKGNVVEEWDSTKEAHVVEGLKTGEKYTLRETVAPEGYLVTTDMTFTIDENGKVTSTGTTTTDENGNTVLLVEDAREGETDIMLGGEKVLQGASLKADQFTFVLKDENGKTISEAKNDADGNFSFDRIAYKLADLNGEKEKAFTYTVSEVKGSDTNITYDESVITVKVTVTDNGDGTITAAADKERSEIKFVNKAKEKKSSSKTSGKSKGGRTGDEAPLGILFGGLGVGAAGLIALFVLRRRKKSEQ